MHLSEESVKLKEKIQKQSITEVNPNLNSNPELVNSDPYGQGWMVRMKLASAADVDGLMDAAAYGQLVG